MISTFCIECYPTGDMTGDRFRMMNSLGWSRWWKKALGRLGRDIGFAKVRYERMSQAVEIGVESGMVAVGLRFRRPMHYRWFKENRQCSAMIESGIVVDTTMPETIIVEALCK